MELLGPLKRDPSPQTLAASTLNLLGGLMGSYKQDKSRNMGYNYSYVPYLKPHL